MQMPGGYIARGFGRYVFGDYYNLHGYEYNHNFLSDLQYCTCKAKETCVDYREVLLNILTSRERSMARTKSRKGLTTTQSAINDHQCANIKDQVYDDLKASNQPSFCPTCLPAVTQFLKLNKRFDDLENRIASLEKELVAKITGPEQKLAAAQQKGTVPQVYSTDSLVSIGKNTEAKKDTAIFLNFRTDDNDDLLIEVKDFTKSISFDPKEIISAKRSGLEVTRNNVTLPRIVKVKCASITAKNYLIKNVNLSQKNIKRNEKIRAHPDLTFAEQEQGRLLHKQLKEKQDIGKNFWQLIILE
uniref:Uncharacterized protein n=1 Tax=Romanomermis culicivorax TaxID=13658 RepID=A0A915HXJ3_ROMCU